MDINKNSVRQGYLRGNSCHIGGSNELLRRTIKQVMNCKNFVLASPGFLIYLLIWLLYIRFLSYGAVGG